MLMCQIGEVSLPWWGKQFLVTCLRLPSGEDTFWRTFGSSMCCFLCHIGNLAYQANSESADVANFPSVGIGQPRFPVVRQDRIERVKKIESIGSSPSGQVVGTVNREQASWVSFNKPKEKVSIEIRWNVCGITRFMGIPGALNWPFQLSDGTFRWHHLYGTIEAINIALLS